jgi:hypothetical protein
VLVDVPVENTNGPTNASILNEIMVTKRAGINVRLEVNLVIDKNIYQSKKPKPANDINPDSHFVFCTQRQRYT